MNFLPTDIPDVILIEPRVRGDERGFFMETYQAQNFAAAGIDAVFVQDNHSRSRRSILRGLHYQIRQAQGKLVRVVAGEIFDVVVDLRRSSRYCGKWVGVHLSAENKRQVWIPPGFAHGFYVLSESADFIYKVTDYYAPQWERTLSWNDPTVGIEWPLIADADHPDGEPPQLSAKDSQGLPFSQLELY